MWAVGPWGRLECLEPICHLGGRVLQAETPQPCKMIVQQFLRREKQIRPPPACMLQPDFEVFYACLPSSFICETHLCSPCYCLHSFLVVARFRFSFGSDDVSTILTLQRSVFSCCFPSTQTQCCCSKPSLCGQGGELSLGPGFVPASCSSILWPALDNSTLQKAGKYTHIGNVLA